LGGDKLAIQVLRNFTENTQEEEDREEAEALVREIEEGSA